MDGLLAVLLGAIFGCLIVITIVTANVLFKILDTLNDISSDTARQAHELRMLRLDGKSLDEKIAEFNSEMESKKKGG